MTVPVSDIRRTRLKAWADEHCSGNVSELARRCDRSVTQISDMLKGRKPFGDMIARRIEENLALPFLYLDMPNDEAMMQEADRRSEAADVTVYGGDKVAGSSLRGALKERYAALVAERLPPDDPLFNAIVASLAFITQDQKRVLLGQLSAMVAKNMSAGEAAGEQFPFANGTAP